MRTYKKILWGIEIGVFAFLCLGAVLVIKGIIPRFVILGMLTALEEKLIIRVSILAAFAFLFVLNFLLPFLIKPGSGEGGAVIPLKNPLGEVEISQKAISGFIQRIGKEIEGIEDVGAKIKSSEEGVDVFLTLSAKTQGEIPRLMDELQTVVKNYLNNTIGIENVREIKVRVAKIL
ncbi:MAG: alkaline shock response membrane anchor protein AmaP [Candidatus Aerophobetes bacterium]|nr:alkaline shock response membrane anchor protein AmaP [Candidatus Aerophobetes bacterium]